MSLKGVEMKKIVILDGHPDPAEGHFINAICDAYESGAQKAGIDVRRIDLAELDFPILRKAQNWEEKAPPSLENAQQSIAWADHIFLAYPMWLGGMPAYTKAFLEQLTCGGFAIAKGEDGKGWRQNFKGKSARIVVTMGMPGQLYRYYFGAHSLKSLERNILGFAGVHPIRDTLIGLVDAMGEKRRAKILSRIARLGAGAR